MCRSRRKQRNSRWPHNFALMRSSCLHLVRMNLLDTISAPFVHQVELLSMQIPGTIASEVSRRMTDSDAVYQKLCRMMPGAEKEKATQEFMREIIGQGVEKCSRLAQRVLDQLEEDLIAALQEKLEQSQQQLERTQQELSALAEAAGDGQQQEKLKAQAELLCAACDLTEELFDREEG